MNITHKIITSLSDEAHADAARGLPGADLAKLVKDAGLVPGEAVIAKPTVVADPSKVTTPRARRPSRASSAAEKASAPAARKATPKASKPSGARGKGTKRDPADLVALTEKIEN